jgi:hypothetical protein
MGVDGWEVTPPTSPIREGLGNWPSIEEYTDARVAVLPGYPLDTLAIEMTIETRSVRGHPSISLLPLSSPTLLLSIL